MPKKKAVGHGAAPAAAPAVHPKKGSGRKVSERKLTRRQEKFVKELVANDGLITMREAAVRAGYPPGSAHSRAHELTSLKHCPHVVREIERYREELDSQYAVTYKRHVRDMKRLRDAALEGGAFSAAVQAEKNRGLAEGLYVSKSEVRTGSLDAMTREEVEAELERLRQTYPETIDITPEVEKQDTESVPES
jgi:phage terminase small subunit